MKETELNKVLNYMKQYVENKYEHDSEPMLNYKDLQLVLEEIERLTELCNKYEEEHKTTFETWQKDIKEIERLKIQVSARETEYEKLHSIIKEAREYIDEHTENIDRGRYYEDYVETYPILEILDKVEVNK